MSEFTIDTSEFARFEGRLGLISMRNYERMRVTMEKAAIMAQTIEKQEAPARTGKLRSSISYQIKTGDGLQAIIGPHAKYAVYVNGGRGVVVPKNKKVLATKINPGWGSANAAGYYIIGKRSKAVDPNPFVQRAFVKVRPEVVVMFMKLQRDIAAEAKG